MYGTTHTSIIDATPDINRNGLALTMPLEFEVARQIEVLLEVGARLWRAGGGGSEWEPWSGLGGGGRGCGGEVRGGIDEWCVGMHVFPVGVGWGGGY